MPPPAFRDAEDAPHIRRAAAASHHATSRVSLRRVAGRAAAFAADSSHATLLHMLGAVLPPLISFSAQACHIFFAYTPLRATLMMTLSPFLAPAARYADRARYALFDSHATLHVEAAMPRVAAAGSADAMPIFARRWPRCSSQRSILL